MYENYLDGLDVSDEEENDGNSDDEEGLEIASIVMDTDSILETDIIQEYLMNSRRVFGKWMSELVTLMST